MDVPQTFPEFLKTLDTIRGSGRFVCSGSVPFVFPGIHLPDGEEIAFPLPKSQALAIAAQAESAPYGKGMKTLHDESVRKCWQLEAGTLSWNSEWDRVIAGITATLAKELGVKGKVVAEPYKLLLYETGGHFLPHRDTEKLDSMFGSLIVALPSAHEGGALHVRHDGEEEVIDFAPGGTGEGVRYAAFFADCEHEVRPVTKGYRLCLAYNLVLRKGDAKGLNLRLTEQAAQLVPHLESLRAARPRDLSAILLEHHYTEANFSLAGLKNNDNARARALLAAAGNAGFRAHLGLVTLHRSGELIEEFDRYSSRGRRGYSRYDEGEEASGKMGEVYEESLTIGPWRDASDREVLLGNFGIDDEQVIAEEAIDADEPDEEEAEGYTGNAGCTMDQWYRRAAIVVWPEEAHEDVCARYDFQAARARFVAMADETGRGKNAAFVALGGALIRVAMAPWAEKTEAVGDYQRECAARRAVRVIAAVAKAGSEDLLHECQNGFLHAVLAVSPAKVWKDFLRAFGDERVRGLFSGTVAPEANLLCNALSGMLSLGKRPSMVVWLAHWLPEVAQGSGEPAYRRYYGDEDGAELTFPQRLHIALAASFLIAEARARKAFSENALAGDALDHLRQSLGPALLAKTHRKHYGAEGSLVPEILEHSLVTLHCEAARPLEPYPDWTRPMSGSSRSAFFKELTAFMADPEASSYSFRRVQHERSEIEDFIRKNQLDLDCETVKKGSPHLLICSKNSHSHQRALKRRVEDEKLLVELEDLGGGLL